VFDGHPALSQDDNIPTPEYNSREGNKILPETCILNVKTNWHAIRH